MANVEADLEAGANPNARHEFDHTPLHGASRGGTLAVLRTLLDAGADRTTMSDSGKTPLFGAAKAYDLANIQTLLKAGADIMARDKYDETALTWRRAVAHRRRYKRFSMLEPMPRPRVRAGRRHGI